MKMTPLEKRFVNSAARKTTVAHNVTSLVEQIPIAAGWRILDVGCGVGSAALAIAQRWDVDVVGIDVDPAQVAAAGSANSRPNLHFQVMDATRLSFGGAEFDLVTSSMATHHIPRWERAVSEMARVLRLGGYLVYIDFSFPHWLARAGRILKPLMSLPSARAFESVAATAGLTAVHGQRRGLQVHAIYQKAH